MIISIKSICSIPGEIEVHDEKLCKYKEELRKLEQSLASLELRLKDETIKLEATTIVPAVVSHVPWSRLLFVSFVFNNIILYFSISSFQSDKGFIVTVVDSEFVFQKNYLETKLGTF